MGNRRAGMKKLLSKNETFFVGQAHRVKGLHEGGTLCEKESVSDKVWWCRVYC